MNVPICGTFDPSKLEYFLYDCHGHWRRSSFEAFLAADDPQISTCFFVPGYEPNRKTDRTKFTESTTNGGWLLYERVAPRCRRFRMVLFLWPAEREKCSKMVPNMRKKLGWSELYGWYLAWLIDQMHPQVPIGLTSDSLGASLLTGSLQVLAGGSVGGQTLDRIHPERRLPRVGMMASTMSNSWLAPGRRHGLALSQVESALITYNRRDRMLKLYRIFGIGGGGMALGQTGEAGGVGIYSDRARFLNVTPYVGGKHWYTAYLKNPAFVNILRPYAFPPPSPEAVDDGAMDDAPVIEAAAQPGDAVAVGATEYKPVDASKECHGLTAVDP